MASYGLAIQLKCPLCFLCSSCANCCSLISLFCLCFEDIFTVCAIKYILQNHAAYPKKVALQSHAGRTTLAAAQSSTEQPTGQAGLPGRAEQARLVWVVISSSKAIQSLHSDSRTLKMGLQIQTRLKPDTDDTADVLALPIYLFWVHTAQKHSAFCTFLHCYTTACRNVSHCHHPKRNYIITQPHYRICECGSLRFKCAISLFQNSNKEHEDKTLKTAAAPAQLCWFLPDDKYLAFSSLRKAIYHEPKLFISFSQKHTMIIQTRKPFIIFCEC